MYKVWETNWYSSCNCCLCELVHIELYDCSSSFISLKIWFCFLKQCAKIWFLWGKTFQLLRNEPSENFKNWFTYLLTYSMEQSPSWKGHWFSASQEIPRILWNLKVHYRIYKCPPTVTNLSWRISGKWVLVTTALSFPSLRLEERPPIWRVAANILNKQSRTTDRGWSSCFGVWARWYQLLAVKPLHVAKESKNKPRCSIWIH